MNSEDIDQFDVDEFKSNAEGLRGGGSFGKVYLCKHEKLEYVVVKCIRLEHCYASKPMIEDRSWKADREVHMLWNMKHPSIVKTFGCVKWEDYYGIVMEYAPCKNLSSLILERKDIKFSYPLCLCLLKEIIDGLIYLHSNDVVHGDLKPDNILLFRGLHAKIADLGSARHPSTISIHSKKDYGTRGYIAPERYSNENIKLSSSMDVYSFAFIAYQFITRENVAFNQREEMAFIARPDMRPTALGKMVEKETNENIESKVLLMRWKGMVDKCWDTDPGKRMSTAETVCQRKNELYCYITKARQRNDYCRTAFAYQVREELENWSDARLKDKVEKEASVIAQKIQYPPYDDSYFEMTLKKCLGSSLNDLTTGKPIVTGGQSTKQHAIILASKDVISLPDLADGRCHHCSVVVQRREEDHLRSRLYVMGGTNKGKVLKSVEYLDLKKKLTDLEQWKFAEDMQECRFLACAETFKEKIYVLGGKNERDEPLDSIECFDPEDDRWTLIQVKLSLKRFDFSTFLHNDFIYCCGGLDSNGKLVHPIDKINPATEDREVWTPKQTEHRFTRYSACAVKTEENKVWFIGGLNKHGRAAEPSVVSYIVNESWQNEKKPIMMQRCSSAAVMVDKTLYVLGGHGLSEKQNNTMTTYEQINLDKETSWSCSTLPDPEKTWAGHSMVVWRPDKW